MFLSKQDQLKIARALWSWQTCERCRSGKSCASLESCPASRLLRLEAYFRTLAGRDLETDGKGTGIIFEDEAPLENLCQDLRSRTAVARHEVLRTLFDSTADVDSEPTGSTVEKEQILDVLVKLMFMVDCSGQSLETVQDLERASFRHAWRSKATMSQFFMAAFPMHDHPRVTEKGTAIVDSLRARHLKQRAGLSFVPTNDLRNHLRLNRKTGEVQVFHQIAFLKEHLRLTLSEPADMEMSECLTR